jgi:hypothetical protein
LRIEQHLFDSVLDIDKSFERAIESVDGFSKATVRSNNDFDITFIDIDHNKQSNLDRFPAHKMITFEDQDLGKK